MARFTLAPTYFLAVTHRQSRVWRKLLWSSLATNVANPIIFLFAFGFGLGTFIDDIAGLSYLEFIVPGMVAYGAMFAASFETTIGSFSRYYMQRNWDAVLATPVNLSELLFGEVLWAGVKAMLSAVSVLVVGALWGGIPALGNAIASLAFVFVAALGFACCGLVATAFARGYEFFSYFFTFWVTPMFVFSGVFFDIERFPAFIQWAAWLLPMTHLIVVIRPLSVGAELDLAGAVLHLGYIVALGVAAFTVAYHRMRKRLFD